MRKGEKKLVGIVIFFMLSLNIKAQSYGYHLTGKITSLPQSVADYPYGSINIYVDNVNVGGLSINADGNDNVGKTYSKFIRISDNAQTIEIKGSSYTSNTHKPRECKRTHSFKTTIAKFTNNPVYFFGGCGLSFRAYAIHLETPLNAEGGPNFCPIDQITLKYGYSWKYSVNGGGFSSFPANINKTSSPTFKLSSLPNIKGGTSGNVKFTCGTNIITVPLIVCSPQIILPFNSTDTKCSYSKDGGFNMNLDRDLNENEELVVGLFAEDKTNPGVYSILVGQNNTETLTDNGDDSYNYQWPDPIEAGNYKVKYQTHPKGENNEPWASLEFSPEFPVGSPPPLFFNAETANDVYCKGGSDGAIKVDAYGGVGKYRYLLNSTTDTIPFTNTNKGTVNARINHTIKNLPKGTKTIKVQDGNGCTEKN